jgi:hypothetical protein
MEHIHKLTPWLVPVLTSYFLCLSLFALLPVPVTCVTSSCACLLDYERYVAFCLLGSQATVIALSLKIFAFVVCSLYTANLVAFLTQEKLQTAVSAFRVAVSGVSALTITITRLLHSPLTITRPLLSPSLTLQTKHILNKQKIFIIYISVAQVTSVDQFIRDSLTACTIGGLTVPLQIRYPVGIASA